MSRADRANELVRELGTDHAERVRDWLYAEATHVRVHALDQAGALRSAAVTALARELDEALRSVGSASDDEE